MKTLRWLLLGVLGAALLTSLGAFLFLATYDFSTAKDDLSRLSLVLTGRRLVIKGDIRPTLGLSPGIEIERLSFQNAAWGSRPDMLTIGRLELKMAVLPIFKGELRIHRLILDDTDLLIEKSAKGLSNLPMSGKKPPPGSGGSGSGSSWGMYFTPDLALEKISVKNGRIRLVDAGSHHRIDMNIHRLAAVVTGVRDPVAFDMDAGLFGREMHVSGSLGSVLTLVHGKPWPVDLDIKAGDDRMSAKGVIGDIINASELNLWVTADVRRPQRLLAKAGLPALVIFPVKASGRLMRRGNEPYSITEFKAASGGSDLSGKATIGFDTPVPQLSATLSARTIDLREAIDSARKRSAAVPGDTKPRKVFSSAPLPRRFLGKLNATVSLKARQCFFPRLALKGLSLTAVMKNGRLTVAPAKAATGGGNLSFTADLRRAGRGLSLSTHVAIRDMDAGQVQEDLGLPRRMEGKLDIDVRLSGRGRSTADILGSADGHISVIMGRGKLNSSLFSRFGGGLESGLARLFTPDHRDVTDITCMVAHFEVDNGLAQCAALVMDTPLMSAAGEGSINLKTEALDMDVTPVPKEGLGASGLGRITISVSELAKPLQLGGTLAEPTLEVDAADTAITIGKAIGGFALFGPFGLVAALVSASGGDDNPCVAAIKIAKEGRKAKPPKPRKKAPSPAPKKKSDGGIFKSLKDKIKNWFGD